MPFTGRGHLYAGWVTGQIFAADGGQVLRGFPDSIYALDKIYGKDIMDEVRAGKAPEADIASR